MIKIVLDNIEKYSKFLPKDISESTVIHLRLGDVIAGTESHELLKRPFSIDELKQILEKDRNKKYVIGKCFFAKTSSKNYEECINKSNIYLQNVLKEFNAEHFDSGDADIDFCCAIKAKSFLQGKGYYGRLITEIRRRLNLHNILKNNIY